VSRLIEIPSGVENTRLETAVQHGGSRSGGDQPEGHGGQVAGNGDLTDANSTTRDSFRSYGLTFSNRLDRAIMVGGAAQEPDPRSGPKINCIVLLHGRMR
jgi:hypothetical protein